MSTVLRIGTHGKVEPVTGASVSAEDLDTRSAVIQALIPVGLEAVAADCNARSRNWPGRAMRTGMGRRTSCAGAGSER
jgi:hypothetical protein